MLIIDDNYYITTDKHNVVLSYELGGISNRTGKTVKTKLNTYHPTLDRALESCLSDKLKHLISKEGKQRVEELLERIDELKQSFMGKGEKIKKIEKSERLLNKSEEDEGNKIGRKEKGEKIRGRRTNKGTKKEKR